ncbi:adenylate/guanylate cyclase domain-containing protein [Leptospira sp. GIMC2001]|uniref:adenylate/guanylate cyclase domain-containing protein n=1 Tax=Leptospira sp. GIMC2001 TaxID=1513297 RepID=UPI00234B355E|nr:adenylate/guanylate cyclase domain-containing protein [Leptospira sp. GIMC2001]WCL50137.1 adenylate/guanylate cyclase domain-containing protein [Leptospira sp. GIMC2001]
MNTRHRVALDIGRHFLDHLDMELAKSSEVLDGSIFDGKTAREIHTGVRNELLSVLPELEITPKPRFNLFLLWWKKNKFVYAYDQFTLDSYNLIFLQRILCLLDWSESSRKDFHRITLDIFNKFDYKRPGFAVSDFLNYENNMRELLREIIFDIPDIDYKEAWDVIYEQSSEYQAVVNEFFENILHIALEDSERLLHNILPVSIATELKEKNRVDPIQVDSATVIFTDFKGFTQLSEKMSAKELIQELDECFSIFDNIIDKYGLEKIKTIGDSYMCAGGIPQSNHTHVFDCALASLEMRDAMNELYNKKISDGKPFWQVRIGFHTGDLTAGVIGNKKFSYDIWGDTVNTASRMESSGSPGQVNVSSAVYNLLYPLFQLESRGAIAAKNKGDMEMYYLLDLKNKYKGKMKISSLSKSNNQSYIENSKSEISKNEYKLGNEEFWSIYSRISRGGKIVVKAR